MTETNILPESVLEEFRCFRCKHFLCTPPIAVLSDGNSLCGICSTSAEETTYRELILENFLKTLKFPCKFKRYGCTAQLRFGETHEHEAQCIHRPRTCPVSPICAWEGPIQQMFDHFKTDHTDKVIDRIEFTLNVRDKDEHGLLLVHVNGINGILRYSYKLALGNLQYNIQHFNADYEEIFLRISITNDSDSDYKFHVKGVSSFFNGSLYTDFPEDSNSKTLSLSNLFPVLNNPDCIVVNMDWQADKSKSLGKRKLVDYTLIETLKCEICKGYLLPPLYKEPKSIYMMCWYCRNKYPQAKPVSGYDTIRLQEVKKTYFPCRWRGCEVIELGKCLIHHELSCMLRMYNCRHCSNNTITKKDIAVHAKTHGYVYFQDCITLSFNPSRNTSVQCYITCKNNNISYITLTDKKDYWLFKFDCEYYSQDSVTNGITVEFEHDHCKLKPTYSVKPSKPFEINIDEISTCFNHTQKIKATLKV